MPDAIQVATTTATEDDARRIAAALVNQRLAACVHVLGPIHSTYGWKGQVETAEEWLCVAKTLHTHYEAVEKAIRELHPYEVPEILATPVVAGSKPYLDWLAAELTPGET